MVEADLLRPKQLLDHPQLRSLIDFERPVGVLLCGIVHYLTDAEEPNGIIARLMALRIWSTTWSALSAGRT